ncbi:MAG: hypothetical protein KatS3mg063_1551 [Tepidiforma sp.]|uniref:hypothetical protein n=1 Tax=Tepidiforma sp. TaxID=2682230 RepID=UPI0021DE5975|nr:hypothetical protein [Tepidiforma sp.]GIW15698.1 MAG: hypothetical protein KatS3mg063_1551 [Tepidiforma sp.]
MIAHVTETAWGLVRVDGTGIGPCLAIIEALADRAATAVGADGWEWTVHQYADGSRTLTLCGPEGQTSPLSGYPLAPEEWLEDIEGVPPEVIEDLAAAGIHRVWRR